MTQEAYENPEVRQALARLYIDLNEQLPKSEQWEIPDDIQELSDREPQPKPKKVGRGRQTV